MNDVPEYVRVMQDLAYWPVVQGDPPIERGVAENPRKKKKRKRPKPPKAQVIPMTPERRRKLMGYFELGQGGLGWYTNIYSDFVQIFPTKLEAELYIKFLAATSPQNRPYQNTLFAWKAFSLWKQFPEEPIPCYDKDIPGGQFRGFMQGHCQNLNRALRGEDLHGPKVSSFDRAMFGDEEAVVVDRWMIRSVGRKVPLTKNAVIVLKDGSRVYGKAIRGKPRRGWNVEYEKKKGEITGDPVYSASGEPLFVVFPIEPVRDGVDFYPDAIIKNITFDEGSPNITLYRGVANTIRRLAQEVGVAPRDCQAAVWTGIKIEEDPIGMQNYVYYFRRHYGENPFTETQYQRIASLVRFEQTRKSIEDEIDVAPVAEAADEREATAIQAANMLH